LNNYSYLKIISNYKILHSSIQNKYAIIDNNEPIESNSLIDNTTIENMKNDFSQLLEELDTKIQERGQSDNDQTLQ
jgi:hypothetical protein